MALIRAARRALAYRELYAEALSTRRRAGDYRELEPAAALEAARALGVPATQAVEELRGLFRLLRRDPPRTVVEIGTDEGGSLFLWTRIAAGDALLVAIDMHPLGPLGARSPWALRRRGLARDRQRIELLMPVDSHDSATGARLRQLLGGRAIDFLFIDGDHTYDGVKRDFEMYAPLVRPGGIVALHDVAADGAEDVVRYWNELKQLHSTVEFVAKREPRYGIGVIPR